MTRRGGGLRSPCLGTVGAFVCVVQDLPWFGGETGDLSCESSPRDERSIGGRIGGPYTEEIKTPPLPPFQDKSLRRKGEGRDTEDRGDDLKRWNQNHRTPR